MLLQILDDGRVTDAQGRSVNFENAVVVMTTNAGSGRSSSALGFASSETKAEKNRIEKALLEFLRPEFINRVDEVIVFNSLSESNFCDIVKIMLGDLKKVLEDRNIVMTYTDNAAKFIAAESYSVKYGARNMRRYIQRNIEDTIAEHIVSDIYGKISCVNISVKSGALHVECN